MALTLIDAAQSGDMTQEQMLIASQFATNVPILEALPFDTISSLSATVIRDTSLPTTTERGLNEGYAESTGKFERVFEPIALLGGDSDVDTKLALTEPGARARQDRMRIQSIAHRFGWLFINGDASTSEKQFTGLQQRATGDRLLSNTGTSAAGALSLSNLNVAIEDVRNPTHLVMSRAMRRLISEYGQKGGTNGSISVTQDSLGRNVTTYADLPIIIADPLGYDTANNTTTPLGFTEAGGDGLGSSATSIYVVSLTEDGLGGIQTDFPTPYDLGEVDDKPVFRLRLDWGCGLRQGDKRSIKRLSSITNAQVTA